MTQSSEHSPTFQRFLAPLEDFRASAEHQRLCHKVPDTEWVNLGIERVIGDHRSGCGFIQERLLRDLLGVTKSHYFESCKSRRRRAHLALGSDGSCKKPHDMGVLKKLEHPAAQDFDRCDPLNAGVLADELVSNSCGTLVRRVRFVVPETGETMEFLTNLGRLIPPGVVAQLYFMRWRIEKSFDEIKNKLHETKAWAMSANAKAMQAAFIVLAYNLAQLLHAKLEQEHDEHGGGGPHDPANQRQRLRRASQLSAIVVERKGQLPLLREVFQKPSQLGIKFYRWLRHHFLDPAPWPAAQARLRLLYNQS